MRFRDFVYSVQRTSGLPVRGPVKGLLRDAYDSLPRDEFYQRAQADLYGRLIIEVDKKGRAREDKKINGILSEILRSISNGKKI